ncbi:hypothetical protein P168DRAFT_324933 [Aspergillus campestris IBT 28561]|uniref:Extracellular membrane protein CFEM domain-containing protein n=1 Tax=Aspergillus campestris (strain IBT 28561) TaxID=1392248 RepID=A0A2I1DCE0_ASPC2|nr:uncharacterized protein P168DRAFT_324933 [Aspergillus campestris IBT 28561]PKY07535.1 hypothetical protein P168DRAFT_324933 [Aspergillus campestris IBT 28561]
MRLLTISTLFTLAATALAETKYTSWSQMKEGLPECTNQCLDKMYKKTTIEKHCGDDASMDCICSIPVAGKKKNTMNEAIRAVSPCIQKECDGGSTNGTEVAIQFADRWNGVIDEQCKRRDPSDDDDKDEENAASVPALGSGMIVLSTVAIMGGFML